MKSIGAAKAAIAALAAFSLLGPSAGQADDAEIIALANRFRALPHCSLGGISIGLVKDGKSTLLSAGKVHPRDGAPREIRADDEFEIGSITKTFTATLYALALREGKVSPDAPAQDFMPEGVVLPVYKGGGKTTPITLDSLARHASGLPRAVQGSPDGLSREEMIDQLRSTQIQFAPGSGFLYSNLGFAVLSLAMEHVYGGKIETLLPEMVAAPLGMSKTHFGVGAAGAQSEIEGYRPNGETAPQDNPTWPAFDGAAALRSTPSDMQQYLLYNMRLANSERLSPLLPALQKTSHFPSRSGDGRPRDIGLAWQNATLPDGRRLIWKDGNVPGFRSFIGFTTTEPQIGVVVMASQNGCRSSKLGRCILESASKSRQDRYCSNPDESAPEFGGEP